MTGGASAMYGSDAIAGVANFIMSRDFEGVQIDAQFGFNWHENSNNHMQGLVDAAGLPRPSGTSTDGDELAVSVVVGGNFADGRGNATGYLSYLDAKPTRLSERDFSACQLQGQGSVCGGSANSNYFVVIDPGRHAGRRHRRQRVHGIRQRAVEWGTEDTNPPPLFNSNPYMNLNHGRERYQGGVFAKYEWSERATLYTDFMFMKDKARRQSRRPDCLLAARFPCSATTR